MSDLPSIALGAVLAIAGGAAGDEFRSWRERSHEREAIKIGLSDELEEIATTLKSMHDVWTQAKVLSQSYVSNLISNTTTFDALRTRLFLIKDEKLRKRIVAFYKRMTDTAKKYEGKLGTLATDTAALAEQADIEKEFQAVATEADGIKKELGK
ncbi:hypothetical protein KBB27_01390 [Patescibacteria group bacterium]|nr:hypothetical protein [Patescibacteria group bacterium]